MSLKPVPPKSGFVPPPTFCKEWKVSLLTPMFGGGYEAGMIDPVHPIRPASVRGHLRIWWRATLGATIAESNTLFERETALWGSDEKPGGIRLQVLDVKPGKIAPCGEYKRNREGRYGFAPELYGKPHYALQPFVGKAVGDRIDIEPSDCLMTATFTLRLTAQNAKLLKEAEQAVIAWGLYGGLGARTRRGCGSIHIEDLPELSLKPLLDDYQRPHLRTVLPGSIVTYGPVCKTAVEAWNIAVSLYKDFRQSFEFARTQGTRKEGRSRYPEADAIRRLASTHYEGTDREGRPKFHAPRHPLTSAFPRAELGLPIIFHFMDTKGPKPDPGDATLEGPDEGRTRFASPIITRAQKVSNGYQPMILVLNAPHAWEAGSLQLSYQRHRAGKGTASVKQSDIALTMDKILFPLVPALHNNLKGLDIRSALVQYAVNNKWTRGRI